MVNNSLEKIKKELDSIDWDGRVRIIEYLIQGIKKDTHNTHTKHTFSDIAGKLKWNGDALAEQRKIRNEW